MLSAVNENYGILDEGDQQVLVRWFCAKTNSRDSDSDMPRGISSTSALFRRQHRWTTHSDADTLALAMDGLAGRPTSGSQRLFSAASSQAGLGAILYLGVSTKHSNSFLADSLRPAVSALLIALNCLAHWPLWL